MARCERLQVEDQNPTIRFGYPRRNSWYPKFLRLFVTVNLIVLGSPLTCHSIAQTQIAKIAKGGRTSVSILLEMSGKAHNSGTFRAHGIAANNPCILLLTHRSQWIVDRFGFPMCLQRQGLGDLPLIPV